MAFFIHSQSSTFHQTILKIEGQNISAIEAAKEINRLKENLTLKQSTQFLPHSVRNLLVQLQENGCVEAEHVKNMVLEFYKTSNEYLQQWTSFNKEELEIFDWATLTEVPQWEEVQKIMDYLIEKRYIDSDKDTEIFDEFSLLCKYITSQKLKEWNSLNVSMENRWVEIFQHFRNNNLNHVHFRLIIEYILCLPGTNAPVERVFSLMNKLWTAEKTQLQVSVLKSMLITKVNINKSCQEFYCYLKSFS